MARDTVNRNDLITRLQATLHRARGDMASSPSPVVRDSGAVVVVLECDAEAFLDETLASCAALSDALAKSFSARVGNGHPIDEAKLLLYALDSEARSAARPLSSPDGPLDRSGRKSGGIFRDRERAHEDRRQAQQAQQERQAAQDVERLQAEIEWQTRARLVAQKRVKELEKTLKEERERRDPVAEARKAIQERIRHDELLAELATKERVAEQDRALEARTLELTRAHELRAEHARWWRMIVERVLITAACLAVVAGMNVWIKRLAEPRALPVEAAAIDSSR